MRSYRVAALLLILVVAGLAGEAEAKKRQLLYINHSAGFKHETAGSSAPLVKEWAEKSGKFDVTVTDDVSQINAANLKKYDAIMFYTTGELPISDEQKKAFLDFIRGGKGFVGVHSATDTFYKWPEYGELIGGYFDLHPWNTDVTIRVEDRDHPSTRHLGASFKIADEIYQFRDWSRQKVKVLMSLDPSSVDLTKKEVHRTDKDFAITWTKSFGKGRMFYTALGHRKEVWEDERFKTHLVNGILWSMGAIK